MVDTDGDLIIKIEEEAEPKVEKVEEKPADDLVKQLADITGQKEAAEKAREAAERRAHENAQAAEQARRDAETARVQATSSNLDTINTAIASANADIASAKRDIKLAGEAGDFDAQAEAYERLAAAKTLALRYDEAKADLEAAKASRTEPASTDPVENFVRGMSPKSASWIRSHPEFVTDSRKTYKMRAAHNEALASGAVADSPEYFEHVEKYLGLHDDTRVDTGDDVRRPGADSVTVSAHERRKPATRQVAPVSGSSNSAARNEVRLTQGEAKSATDGTLVWNYDDPTGQKRFKKGDPIGTQEMARRKLEMQRQGIYDRINDLQ